MQNIWIFQLKSRLSAEQEIALRTRLTEQLEGWQAHKQKVHYRFELKYGHFIVIEALSPVSGCGIDSMMQMIQNISHEFEFEICDSGEIFFKSNFSQDFELKSVHFQQLDKAFASGSLKPDTIVFDHQAAYRGDWGKWENELANTWLKRFLPTP